MSGDYAIIVQLRLSLPSSFKVIVLFLYLVSLLRRDGQKHRQTDREREREREGGGGGGVREKQTERQTDRRMDGWMDLV